MKKIIIWSIMIAATADLITTHLGYHLVELYETNPLLKESIYRVDGILYKMLVSLAVAIIFGKLYERYRTFFPLRISVCLGTLYSVFYLLDATIWNTLQILIDKGVIQ